MHLTRAPADPCTGRGLGAIALLDKLPAMGASDEFGHHVP